MTLQTLLNVRSVLAVFGSDLVGFACPMTGLDVLNRFAHEHDRLVVSRRLLHVGADEAFGAKLLISRRNP